MTAVCGARRVRYAPQLLNPELWRFNFDTLPLLVEGDSKIIRRYGPGMVIERFKPTVYSFTHNRYGIAPGTEDVRARFSAATFHYLMNRDYDDDQPASCAFAGLIERPDGLYTLQNLVRTCNLEVRVKRYHIGSPVHRYLYTEQHPSVQADQAPLERWSRLDEPVVCFDWRHPLTSLEGVRLADEPISDDYAAIWMRNIPDAKALAVRTFLRLEELFSRSSLILIDICFFIDQTGRFLFGEISPDCMRVREGTANLATAESLDKDQWRDGASPETILASYQRLYERVFG